MEKTYTFREAIDITHHVIEQFEQVEQRPWILEGSMIELMKQVGDLSKHIMMMEKYYLATRATNPVYSTTIDDIGDELADILYCLIRIAKYYNIDLEQAHFNARRREMQSLGIEPDF